MYGVPWTVDQTMVCGHFTKVSRTGGTCMHCSGHRKLLMPSMCLCTCNSGLQCTAYIQALVSARSIATNLVQYLIDVLNFSVTDANTTVTNWCGPELALSRCVTCLPALSHDHCRADEHCYVGGCAQVWNLLHSAAAWRVHRGFVLGAVCNHHCVFHHLHAGAHC